MSKTFIPKDYEPKLDLFQTQMAIEIIKSKFQKELGEKLNLRRVSAPLFVDPTTGINDNLNGYERPVSFDIKETGTYAEVVHSLAKWKRMALFKYGFKELTGLYTDMNAIRRDEEMDNLHSIYIDQWDWEKIITKETRNIEYLKDTVKNIVFAICNTLDSLKVIYPEITTTLSKDVTFITTEELYNLYPELTPKERENEFVKAHKTCFIMKIGDLLPNGKKHDGRAPDYDDWTLNGDILFWNDILECAFEVSSMGIRVDKTSLKEQLIKSGCKDRKNLPFHKMILNESLPLTLGGGIGQSRLCMLLLGKAHIGEVHSSIWDKDTLKICRDNNINLL
ncbi:MAG: aspartate--ammonia ligase [Clostridium sp.]|uniref:aspartate--ammonia ligase n=1 Tax=Clostridium sp. TaxID=1506 RepID=UPI002911D9D5|nr:aspartate--ammonia ligase [Clostridium sp.]MDU4938974.1 aspartate--ammonia ligase [Clostridium sp.]